MADLQELCDLKREYDTFCTWTRRTLSEFGERTGWDVAKNKGALMILILSWVLFGKAFASYGAFVVCDEMFRISW